MSASRCATSSVGLTHLLRVGLWLALSASLLPKAVADELPARIDSLIAAAVKDGPLGPTCDDATFVRRAYLDLAGRIPSWQEATTFLDNKEANKRTQLIDTLLASSDFPRRMQDLFHAMLMERRGDSPEWTKFLRSSFESNKPWDQLVREILDPDPNSEATRGAAFFHTKRLEKVGQQETDYPGLTRDVGRLFLGMDLQCAQCHNHLFIESYKQVDFQGLYTVYQNTFIRTDLKFPAIGEKVLTKKADFSSVFDKVSLTTGPRVPGGKEIEIPTFEKSEEYLVPPDRKTNFPGTPRFRAMQFIATELPTATNKAFADNIANRLWFVMMGRGLVNPLDQQHAANRPSHPEVLDLLAHEIVAQKFDMKSMLRQLALTETYQRTTVLAEGVEPPKPESYRIANEKRLSAEQLASSVLVATGSRDKPREADVEKLRTAFVKAFANVPQDPEIEFSPSLKSSLFVLNDPAVLDGLTPQLGNLVERLLKTTDSAALADELYLSVLTRQPTDEERTAIAEYLSKNPERRSAAITNLTWALLASTEFCLNH
ncbi:MAG: DUF1549 domain-containing protein [Planctomycetaceae bacterium]